MPGPTFTKHTARTLQVGDVIKVLISRHRPPNNHPREAFPSATKLTSNGRPVYDVTVTELRPTGIRNRVHILATTILPTAQPGAEVQVWDVAAHQTFWTRDYQTAPTVNPDQTTIPTP